MNVRQAILAAADHIERNPNGLRFSKPISTGYMADPAQGCALVWISRFGVGGRRAGETARTLLGICAPEGVAECEFFGRMDGLCHDGDWKDNAADCAAALRKYADKYHPEKKEKKGIPPEILSIFDKTYTAQDLCV